MFWFLKVQKFNLSPTLALNYTKATRSRVGLVSCPFYILILQMTCSWNLHQRYFLKKIILFGRCDTLTVITKVIVKATELNNKIYMRYKLGQARVTNWGSFVLLQIRIIIVTNWGSFIITNLSECCYKLGQLLQIRANVTTK